MRGCVAIMCAVILGTFGAPAMASIDGDAWKPTTCAVDMRPFEAELQQINKDLTDAAAELRKVYGHRPVETFYAAAVAAEVMEADRKRRQLVAFIGQVRLRQC